MKFIEEKINRKVNVHLKDLIRRMKDGCVDMHYERRKR